MIDRLRTELHPEVQQVLEEKKEQGRHVRSNHLSVEGARKLKRNTMQELGWLEDPEPVGAVRQYSLEVNDGEVPIRIYNPAGEGPFPTLVWLHSGGWSRGSIDDNDPLCRALVKQAECTVVSVGYRLAPEYPFPIGLEDCYTALGWVERNHDIVLGDPNRIAIGGMSSGGNLTVAVALLARDRGGPSLIRQIPCVPVLDRPRSTKSYEENATGYGLSRADMDWYWSNYIRNNIDEANRYASPLQAKDFSKMPPATVLTAGFDPLREDGIEYINRLREAGVSVEHIHYPDMAHSVISTAYYYNNIGRTREAIETLAGSLQRTFEI